MSSCAYSNKQSVISATVNGKASTWFLKDQQLDDSLVLVRNEIHRRFKPGKPARDDDRPTLPGYPTKFLDNTAQNNEKIVNFMAKEFATPRLNRMAPHLWLVATEDHAHIAPIHENLVRGRQVVVTENPELHLTWIDDRIFLKPIPAYLTSYAFWERYLGSLPRPVFEEKTTSVLQPAILGFLRSWTYLVRYESDYLLAKEANLIPRNVSYVKFMRFIANFEGTEENPRVKDSMVSPRYTYGQLRLSRLNRWAKVWLRHWNFEQVHWQYWQYFQSYYGPLLFMFALFSLVLSAMQVGMTDADVWPAFANASLWFAVVTLFIVALTAVGLVVLFLAKVLRELCFVMRAKK